MTIMKIQTVILTLTYFILVSTTNAIEMQLLIVTDDNCEYCELWEEEIGYMYAKSPEGQTAPLLRQDIHKELPDMIYLRSSPFFTPTFILLVDSFEVSRFEGYPGEDFFWPVLNQMITEALD